MYAEQNNDNQFKSILKVVNISKGATVVANCVELAGTSAERRQGLLDRSSINHDQGMYIVPSQCVHTFRMKFIIDIAFLAADGRVLAMQHSLKPNRISKLIFRAEGVLELAAGRLKDTDTQVGDIFEFR